MLHYWLTVVIKTVSDSLRFTDRSGTGVLFGVLGLVVTGSYQLYKYHGVGAAMKQWRKVLIEGSLEALGIGVTTFLIVCLIHLAWEPFHLQNDEVERTNLARQEREKAINDNNICASDFRNSQTRSELLQGQVTAQQTQISNQQTISSTQQNTFNLCVATLANINTPEKENMTLLMRKFDPAALQKDGQFITLLTLLTNKNGASASFVVHCNGVIKTVNVMPSDGNGFHESAVKLLDSNTAFAGMTAPSWSPTKPIFIEVGHDDPKLDTCSVRQQS